MSTPTSNTSVTSSSLSIGLIVGGIVIAVAVIAVIIYMIKSRRGGANLGAVPSGAPTAANGLGVGNNGSNAVPKTNFNMNAGRTTA